MTKLLIAIAMAGMAVAGLLTAVLAKTPPPNYESGVIINTSWGCVKCLYAPDLPQCKKCPHGPYNPDQQ